MRQTYVRRGLVLYVRSLLAFDPTNGCWLWQGMMTMDGRPIVTEEGVPVNVRRMLYDIKYGPLSGRDHLSPGCLVERCVRPDHQNKAERGPVVGTMGRFDRSKFDVCPKGHALTPDNAYVYRGKKLCRRCRAFAERNYRKRVRSQE